MARQESSNSGALSRTSFKKGDDGSQALGGTKQDNKGKEMKVKIRLSCSDLKKMDRIFGKSDPYIKVMENKGTEEKEDWVQIGQTEIIYNNLNPIFKEIINCSYYF